MVVEQFSIKKSLIPNHLWKTVEEILDNLSVSSPQFPFDVLELWDELNEKFDCYVEWICKYRKVDICLTSNYKFKELSIASTVQANRLVAVELIKQRIATLNSKGVNDFTVTSPVKLGNDIEALCLSLLDICQFAIMKDCSISFEAFDCNADKFRLVGDTYIVKEIFNRIREQGGYNFFLTWDLAHFALEEGNYVESLVDLLPFIKRIHISNYSRDKSKWYYGDKHLPFEVVGEISSSDIQSIIEYILNNKSGIESIAFEVAPEQRLQICYDSKVTYRYITSLLEHLK